jgi:WD40 repeat protein
MQRKLLLVDAEAGRTLRELVCEGLPPDCDPISTAVSRDARLCAAGYTASNGYRIGIWNLSEGKLLRLFKTQDQGWILSLAFSPDGSVLASGATDCTASVWEVATGPEIGRLRLRGNYADMHVSVSDDSRWLAAGSDSWLVRNVSFCLPCTCAAKASTLPTKASASNSISFRFMLEIPV